MKSTVTICILLLLSSISFAQITTTKVAEKKLEIITAPYDSTLNFLGKDVYKYIGQELYLKGLSEDLRKYEYDGFYLDYTKDDWLPSNRYKPGNIYSKYDELAEKYFKVLAVHKHPSASEYEIYKDTYYLELEEKESGDKVYFEYSSRFEHAFPFIVVGFFEKQKKFVVGHEFVFRNIWFEESTDIETGNEITIIPGQKWKCIDLTIEEEYYSLSGLLENPLGEIATTRYEWLFGEDLKSLLKGQIYTSLEAEMYEKKFGKDKWLKILDGQVEIGFTEEMVRLSLLTPKEINKTSNGEQWVYEDKNLYFENGVLVSKDREIEKFKVENVKMIKEYPNAWTVKGFIRNNDSQSIKGWVKIKFINSNGDIVHSFNAYVNDGDPIDPGQAGSFSYTTDPSDFNGIVEYRVIFNEK